MNLNLHVRQHLLYYGALIAIQIVGFAVFLLVSPDHTLQISITLLTTSLCTGLGLLHHHQNHTLTSLIVVEYVLIAAIGISLMFIYLK